MIKFDVKNWTGAVQFTAEIDCDESASTSFKLGLAVRWAVKMRANLTGANLMGLTGANLMDALEVDEKDIPVIPNIDAKILKEIEAGGILNMSSWHGPHDNWCGTTHCRAGWAIHCAGKKGKALQDRFGPQIAGTLIYQASRPGKPAPPFFVSSGDALADIIKCAAEQQGAIAQCKVMDKKLDKIAEKLESLT